MEFDALSKQVIGCALEVHRHLGPGLLESTYEQCLAHELSCAKLPFQLQVPLPVEYKDMRLECGYRIDVFVDGRLIVELKSVEKHLHEIGASSNRIIDQLQRKASQRRYPTLRALMSSCSSCSSW